MNTRTGKHAYVDGGKYHLSTAVGSVKGSTIAYGKLYPGETEYELGVEVFDVTTGKTKLLPQSGTPQALGQTAVTKDSVVWLVDEVEDQGQMAVRRSAPDGTGLKDISPETGDGALFAYDLTASDEALTVTAQTPDTAYRNETLPKLWQLTPDGSRVQRVSCNRGEQSSAAADGGRMGGVDRRHHRLDRPGDPGAARGQLRLTAKARPERPDPRRTARRGSSGRPPPTRGGRWSPGPARREPSAAGR